MMNFLLSGDLLYILRRFSDIVVVENYICDDLPLQKITLYIYRIAIIKFTS